MRRLGGLLYIDNKLMGYKVFVENNETFFKYKPFKKIKKSLDLNVKKDNPFEALKELDLK